MRDKPQLGFMTTELDPDLLSTPFGVQTKWHVITGAPCSGKTTLIDLMAGKGYRTIPQIGRVYVEGEMELCTSKGLSSSGPGTFLLGLAIL